MTNTQRYAQRELDILVKSSPDPDNRPIIEPFIPEILALCERFGKSGQSGGSAPFTATALAQAVKKLCLQEPVCPIMGIGEEWMDVSRIGDGNNSNEDMLFQNTRCGALFKGINGRAWYLDAICWKNQKGITWSGSAILKDGSKIRSRQYVKNFPFTPKTFYIDVIEKEIAKDDWEFYVKNERQLIPVFRYYDRFTH